MTPLGVTQQLILKYGNVKAAGIAYNDRYGHKNTQSGGAGARLIHRIKNGADVKLSTLDKLETLLYG